MNYIAAMVVASTICPLPLVPFEVTRSTGPDGITVTTGGVTRDTRTVFTNYEDNRTTAVSRFWTAGSVTLQAHGRPRLLKYRMAVDLPAGEYEMVLNPDDKEWVGNFSACIEDERLVIYVERPVFPGNPRTTSWDVIVFISVGADINGDGDVDGRDLGMILSGWGSSGPGDLNGDGVVDGSDLGVFFVHWTG